MLGGDDAVARVTGSQPTGGVLRGGQVRLLDAEFGDPAGRLRVAVDVPGVDESRCPHASSSIGDTSWDSINV